tara:strand:+ start:4474 stop:5208 length:735 start_codon:yes stop_codon:yes gene_type:complete
MVIDSTRELIAALSFGGIVVGGFVAVGYFLKGSGETRLADQKAKHAPPIGIEELLVGPSSAPSVNDPHFGYTDNPSLDEIEAISNGLLRRVLVEGVIEKATPMKEDTLMTEQDTPWSNVQYQVLTIDGHEVYFAIGDVTWPRLTKDHLPDVYRMDRIEDHTFSVGDRVRFMGTYVTEAIKDKYRIARGLNSLESGTTLVTTMVPWHSVEIDESQDANRMVRANIDWYGRSRSLDNVSFPGFHSA